MKKSWIIAIIGGIIAVLSCQNGNEKKAPSIMYEQSDLAKLMRNMHDSLEAWKLPIEAGENLHLNYPNTFNNIHDAEATNPSEINEVYHMMADIYLDKVSALTEDSVGPTINNYNALVNTCVTCHQSFCTGPIPKIQKLHIKQ